MKHYQVCLAIISWLQIVFREKVPVNYVLYFEVLTEFEFLAFFGINFENNHKNQF